MNTITNEVQNDKYKLKRLLYQSTHRGCKELDIILGTFATTKVTTEFGEIENLFTLTQSQLDDYEDLSNQSEWDIYSWITGEKSCPNNFCNIINKIVEFNKNYNKNIR